MDERLKQDPVFGVIGGGSWATAIVKLLSDNGTRLNWYMRDMSAVEHIEKYHHHSKYLTSVELDADSFTLTNNIDYVVSDSDILIFVVPSAYFIKEVSKVTASYDHKLLISAVKGFVGDRHQTVAEYFHDKHKVPFDRIGVISGPCHAEEVGMERLSYITLSSKHIEVAEYLCGFFKNHYVNTIACTDIYGVEYAAALKNVYAIAAGICYGAGYGDNFMAVLIASCFREMKEFINVTNPDSRRNTSRSAYLGDLLVTCNSPFSRNRNFGSMLGKGYSVQTAMLEMSQVAEGYYVTKAIHEINARYGVEMPIADAVYSVLYEQKSPVRVMHRLEDRLM
ncbi:MAG TPA: NAD(P)H-dependent glycerol-3-phosphate dehydrogenase [Candidatus Coprenecus pullistercoris]|nr:NAD(P)H-dependent glycerol-3-phosphate dehydrogenase [Candidatus Coprenecus pullistercoris]